ncbi:MAG TPA: NfeD family protein [Methylomirabilota bacterium]|nr:NfeD family protein [Methylomirabilota bacterium]
MKTWLALLSLLVTLGGVAGADAPAREKTALIIPIRDAIMPPLVYLVRRGVKQAIEEKADLLVLDMKTDGGRLDTTEDIIEIIGQFKGETVTYVNDRAFSAGAFIAVATKKIYMAPQSVIGAAAPIMMAPGGSAEAVPETMEIKTRSAVRALVRRTAEKNGHNPEVLEAMIDRNKELIMDGETINKTGDILTLTDTEASRSYGDPAKPLLSAGTIESLDTLLATLGYGAARRIALKPTGTEKLGTWINAISPVLLIIGVIGLYIEFKTPGFGLPGIVALCAFALYFVGGYIAGFSGFEWMLVFLVGVILLALEFFVFPGTVALGVIGAFLMVVAVIMALVDLYPSVPSSPGGVSWPTFTGPTRESFEHSMRVMLIAAGGVAVGVWLASKWLPKTSIYAALVSQGTSGAATTASFVTQENAMLGQTGRTISPLRPGGKAQFGDAVVDVMSQGDLIEKGCAVRIVSFSAGTAVVEVI